MVRDGRPCYCGKKGCVDAYCSPVSSSGSSSSSQGLFLPLLSFSVTHKTVTVCILPHIHNTASFPRFLPAVIP
ncbi:MAG: hypothetical protein LBG57_14760 [Treponema sp.]|nr:hypothetical protein [Treponema sp.]